MAPLFDSLSAFKRIPFVIYKTGKKACTRNNFGISFDFPFIANFFIFIKNELRSAESDDIISAFKTFDHETTGFIDAPSLREICGNLGDILDMEELDKVIEISDVDGRFLCPVPSREKRIPNYL